MIRQRWVTAIALFLTACGGTAPGASEPRHHDGGKTSAPAEPLPFIHDDFPKALAESRRQNKPLFVDAWAPWCHSCQSLRAHVLTDPELAPLASSFVWLSVDTERDVNAEWVAKYPHSALPTLWVLDPKTDRPILKWAGTATATELRDLLAVSLGGSGGDAADPRVEATAAFVRGNHALAEGDAETAIKEHRVALAAASPTHPQRARIAEALVTELSLHRKHAACIEVASAEAATLPPGTSRASVIITGLSCARSAEPKTSAPGLVALAKRDASARDASLLADDRAALYEEIVETLRSIGQDAEARKLAAEWATYLEAEAARAKTKDARAALDPMRLGAYLALSEPARAIPMLEASERDFPEDYNPPARLGRVYLELKRLDEAGRAADRAIARVYGPRAMRVCSLVADIAKARGDRAGEKKALDEALARSEHAVLTEGQKGVREALVRRRASLD